jgi:hypothetical protein
MRAGTSRHKTKPGLERAAEGGYCAAARGRSSEAERQLPKLNVGGSIPPARSSIFKHHRHAGLGRYRHSVAGRFPGKLAGVKVTPGNDLPAKIKLPASTVFHLDTVIFDGTLPPEPHRPAIIGRFGRPVEAIWNAVN